MDFKLVGLGIRPRNWSASESELCLLWIDLGINHRLLFPISQTLCSQYATFPNPMMMQRTCVVFPPKNFAKFQGFMEKNLNFIFSLFFTKNTSTIHLCWIIQQKDSRLILHVYVVIHQSQKIPYFFLKIAIWHETFWQAFMLGQFLFCRMSLTFNIWTTRSYSLNFRYQTSNRILISIWTTASYSLNWEDPKLSIYEQEGYIPKK